MMPTLTNKDLLTIIGTGFAALVLAPLIVVSTIVKSHKTIDTVLDKIIFGCKIFYLLATWSYWGAVCLPFFLSLSGTVALILAIFITAFHITLACTLLYHIMQTEGFFDE